MRDEEVGFDFLPRKPPRKLLICPPPTNCDIDGIGVDVGVDPDDEPDEKEEDEEEEEGTA